MNRDETARRTNIVCAAERVLGSDPAQVWALMADPARVGEWAPLEVVGYMGTELPKSGQIVFLRTRRWRPRSRERRVEVEEWEAGSRYRCEISTEAGSAICFEVFVTPEVTGGAIATRIRLKQRMEVAAAPSALLRRLVSRQLERRLNRIELALRS